MIQANYVNPSVCQCGFPVLRETVPIGKAYTVDASRILPFKWICGGCGREQSVNGIYVSGPGDKGGFLPIDIFDLPNVK